MDWLNEFPEVTGIDKVVAEAARRLMAGPVFFRSQFFDGEVRIEDLRDYRAWTKTVSRLNNEPGADFRRRELRDVEIKRE